MFLASLGKIVFFRNGLPFKICRHEISLIWNAEKSVTKPLPEGHRVVQVQSYSWHKRWKVDVTHHIVRCYNRVWAHQNQRNFLKIDRVSDDVMHPICCYSHHNTMLDKGLT